MSLLLPAQPARLCAQVSACSQQPTTYRQRIRCNGQVISGNENTIFGNDNIIVGDKNKVYGKRNTVLGEENFVRGGDNYTDPVDSNIVDTSNIEDGDDSSSSSNNTALDEELINFFSTALPGLLGCPVSVIRGRALDPPPPPQPVHLTYRNAHALSQPEFSSRLSLRPFSYRARRLRTGYDPDVLNTLMQLQQRSAANEQRNVRIQESRRRNISIRPELDRKAAEHESSCVICYENVPCVVFEACGHMACCATCSRNIEKCPLCNTHHGGTIQVTFAGRDPESSIKTS